MSEAFLVITIDSSGIQPRVISAGIYSEPWETLTLSHKPTLCYANLASATADSYEAARQQVLEQVKAYRGIRWVLKMLGEPESMTVWQQIMETEDD